MESRQPDGPRDQATLTLANVAPTAHANGPYTGDEGAAITLNGSATDPASNKLMIGLLDAAGEQPILAAEELVTDERGEEVDGRQRGGLGFEQTGLEAGGHAGAAELAEGALQFDEVHGVASWAFRAMTSR